MWSEEPIAFRSQLSTEAHQPHWLHLLRFSFLSWHLMTPYYSLSDYLSILSNGCSGDSALYLYMSPSIETLLKVICHKAAQIISRVKGWCIGRSIHFYGPVFSLLHLSSPFIFSSYPSLLFPFEP